MPGPFFAVAPTERGARDDALQIVSQAVHGIAVKPARHGT
jgi:hypothetical protein